MEMIEKVIASGSFNILGHAILVNGAYKATKYLSDKLTIKATRKRYKGRQLDNVFDIVFTVGKPNYQERAFIKQCKKAGEPIPVKKIQVKFPK